MSARMPASTYTNLLRAVAVGMGCAAATGGKPDCRQLHSEPLQRESICRLALHEVYNLQLKHIETTCSAPS